jgi:hypothetical protein
MGKTFSSDEELKVIVMDVSGKAVRKTIEDIFDIFIEEYVNKYAYSNGNTWYLGDSGVPSGQFRESWRKKFRRDEENELVGTIFYNPIGHMVDNSASYNLWRHYSKFEGWESAIPHMDVLLNKAGSTSSLGWNDRAEAYWDLFISEMFDSGEAARMLQTNINFL